MAGVKARVSLSVLLLVLALAVGCAASTPAWGYEFYVGGLALSKATSWEGASLSLAKIETSETSVECKKDPLEGLLLLEGKSTATLLLKECTVVKPSQCKVAEPITGKLVGELGESENQIVDELAGSGEKGLIAELHFENKGAETCSLGKAKLLGTQTCEIIKGEKELLEHELACKPSGSNLKLGTTSAKFTSSEEAKTVPPLNLHLAPLFDGPSWIVDKKPLGQLEHKEFEIEKYVSGPTIELGEKVGGVRKLGVSCDISKSSANPPPSVIKGSAARRVGTAIDKLFLSECEVEEFNVLHANCTVRSVWQSGSEIIKSPINTIGTELHPVELEAEMGFPGSTGRRLEAALIFTGTEAFMGTSKVLFTLEFGGMECPVNVEIGAHMPFTGQFVALLSKQKGTNEDEVIFPEEEFTKLVLPNPETQTIELWNPSSRAGYGAKTVNIKEGGEEGNIKAQEMWKLASGLEFGFYAG
jgi:hypothetical protein